MGSSKSKLEDSLQENKRIVNRTIRSLERQKLASEREEEKLVEKLRVEARAGRMNNVKLMARDVLRNRKMGDHYCNMRSQMMAVQSQLQTAYNTNKISNSLKSVSDLMTQVNCDTKVAEFQKIMNNISQQAEMLNLKLEIMEDTMETSLIDGDNAQEEKAVNQLLQELGIEVDVGDKTEKTKQNEVMRALDGNTKDSGGIKETELKNEMLRIEERISNLKK
ncbi:uncharacterized protein TOT_020000651 [Theileria orientalis strain Shintoku]|uniref:SNF7 family protein n=1 Tax=Theileria orientalis strain Shintoku TaxID=869250 RepID=J4DPB1_THEOR|nr:uncharacterized protein TOT_020000651 [Theileria orientalis strain Shintoku]BAM40394.1 uncharacterized protein TOT_020000651 [Theileria orientalis strain Shintoku]|eukprot:XP_009690695.1 uncharacterized protein TOT_020000651 [Theileria orientalis strain Shintoku]